MLKNKIFTLVTLMSFNAFPLESERLIFTNFINCHDQKEEKIKDCLDQYVAIDQLMSDERIKIYKWALSKNKHDYVFENCKDRDLDLANSLLKADKDLQSVFCFHHQKKEKFKMGFIFFSKNNKIVQIKDLND